MADEQDRAEALDDDKLEDDPHVGAADERAGIDVMDQTADADPSIADSGRAVIDELETGDDLDGVRGEPDVAPDPAHTEGPAPEVSAMHLTDEP